MVNSSIVEIPAVRNLIFAVYDEKTKAYSTQLLTHPTVEAAIRSFTAACKNPQSFLFQFPSDYTLYHIANYDEVSARIIPLPQPDFVIRATEILNLLAKDLIKNNPEVPNAV